MSYKKYVPVGFCVICEWKTFFAPRRNVFYSLLCVCVYAGTLSYISKHSYAFKCHVFVKSAHNDDFVYCIIWRFMHILDTHIVYCKHTKKHCVAHWLQFRGCGCIITSSCRVCQCFSGNSWCLVWNLISIKQRGQRLFGKKIFWTSKQVENDWNDFGHPTSQQWCFSNHMTILLNPVIHYTPSFSLLILLHFNLMQKTTTICTKLNEERKSTRVICKFYTSMWAGSSLNWLHTDNNSLSLISTMRVLGMWEEPGDAYLVR